MYKIQLDFTYHQLQVELGIYAMATYVDIDSPAPLRSLQGVEINTGKIPRFKHGFKLNGENNPRADDYGQ